jgi:hypothetical protein
VTLAYCTRPTVPFSPVPDEHHELKVVTTVGSATEATLVCGRLMEAGIRASHGGGRWSAKGARDVYVEAHDLDRAHAVLKDDEGGFSEEELARLSEEAGGADAEDDSSAAPIQPTSPKGGDRQRKPDEPVATPVAKRHHVFNVLERLARGKPDEGSPHNPFGH